MCDYDRTQSNTRPPLRDFAGDVPTRREIMLSIKFEFSMRELEALPPPSDCKRVYYYDTQTRCVAFCVQATGTKSFHYCRKIYGHKRRKCLGRFPEVTLQDARAKAKKISSAIAKGEHPLDTPMTQAPTDITLSQLFDMYLELHAKPRHKRWKNSESSFRLHFHCFSARVTSTITRLEVQNWVNRLGKTSHHLANRNYDLLRSIINWGIKKEVINHRSPCLGADRFRVRSRERFVQPGDEFDRLAAAIDAEADATIRDFFWMCLYTGARRGNILAMRWEDINFDFQAWDIPDSKNGDTLRIGLVDQAIEILERRKMTSNSIWVFESPRTKGHFVCPKNAWDRIRRRANLPGLRIHDLRRTLGSYMAIQGASPFIIGKALGHRSIQATAIYARLTVAPARAAMEDALKELARPTKRD